VELILGYLAGIFTLINPCVLPVLPVVLGSAVQSSRYGPLALALPLLYWSERLQMSLRSEILALPHPNTFE